MMRRLTIAAMLVASGGSAMAEAPCRPDLRAILSPAEFARYPARVEQGRRWTKPDTAGGEARRYRTLLQQQGAAAPDFAGRYRVVQIGCGAGAVCPAFVDRVSGAVHFPPDLRVASAIQVEANTGFEILNYRPDSRLLVLIGSPGEDRQRSGVSYYEWTEGALRLIRFLPQARFCSGERP